MIQVNIACGTYIKAISDELIANALSKGTSQWISPLCLITSTSKWQSEIQGTNFFIAMKS